MTRLHPIVSRHFCRQTDALMHRSKKQHMQERQDDNDNDNDQHAARAR